MNKALRIILKQSSANYKKEEVHVNKMTYPLPPLSTVLGAIHNACNYREYKKMDISIQGKYESMHKEPYIDYCFLNSLQDDRGILVKMKNECLLSTAFDKVASAKKQGSNIRDGVEIEIFNQNLLDEYRALKELDDKIKSYKSKEYKQKIDFYKNEKKKLADEKKNLDKKSQAYKDIVQKEKEIKEEENKYKENVKKYEIEHYITPISKYKSLTTSLKFYEILNNIELVLHIKSDEDTLKDIEENIYNLKAIGRSEDFVDVIECKLVELVEFSEDDDYEVISEYSAYLDYDDVYNERVYTKPECGRNISGTKYHLNRNYKIIDEKRVFEKKKVVYASNYSIDKTSKNIYVDKDSDKEYIVNFL